jgi:glycerol-3-phosphate dehydrogenase
MDGERNQVEARGREARAANCENVSIIGDGGMGSVLAMLLCEKNKRVRMWGYDREQLGQIEARRENEVMR